MEKISLAHFRVPVTAILLATLFQHIVQSAHIEIDHPTNIPSKLADIPVVLPKSWPTVDPTYIPENISAEVIESSEELVKRLRARSGHLSPNRKPYDFHNYERNQHGLATKNYCEYKGRYIRRGAQKYIVETDSVAFCRSVDPLWIAVYLCEALATQPQRYKDLTPKQLEMCSKACQGRRGAKTKPPVGVPDWQQRMNEVSEKMKTEVFTTTGPPRFSRRLRPLNEAAALTKKKRRYVRTTTMKSMPPIWDHINSRVFSITTTVSPSIDTGVWFTTTLSTPDKIQQLLRKIKGATLDSNVINTIPEKEEQTTRQTREMKSSTDFDY